MVLDQTLIATGMGCIGGITRSVIGILKAKKRKDTIRIGYIFRTIRLSAFSGTFFGAVFSFNPIMSFAAGYVGSDIIEGMYTSLKNTTWGKKHFEL